jgi:hypothetical protein
VLFLGVGAMLAVLAGRRDRALGASVLTWFGLVFVYDLVVLGGSSLLASGPVLRRLLAGSVLRNPVELVRGGGLVVLSGIDSLGPAWGTLLRTLGGPGPTAAWAAASLALWCRHWSRRGSSAGATCSRAHAGPAASAVLGRAPPLSVSHC